MNLTFSTFIIPSWDQYHIDRIEEDLNEFLGLARYTIYQWDAPLYISDNTASHDITNQVILHLISEGIYHLDIPDTIKDILTESIYTNCLDSGIDLDIDTIPEEYRDRVQSFKDIF